LLHTWSLAVEEQYYVLFPIFLILAWRFGKNRVFWMIVVIAAISLMISEWGWRNKATANFYLAPTRAWELFAGSIAAFIVQKHDVQENNFLALFGLAAIIFSIFGYDESTPFPSVYALVPVLGVVLLILYASKDTLVGKLLSAKAFVGIGLISYSAYLWHQPLFAFARIRSIEPVSIDITILLIVVTLSLAFLSWNYVEKPFRKASNFQRKTVFVSSLIGCLLFISAGFFGHTSNGFKERYSSYELYEAAFPLRENGFCFLSFKRNGLFERNGLRSSESIAACDLANGHLGPKGLIIGDSFAAQYEPFWKLLAEDLKFNLTSVTTNSCFPTSRLQFRINASDESLKQCKNNRKFLKDNLADFDFFVIGAAWGDYYEDNFVSEVKHLVEELEGKLLIIMAAPKYLALDNVAIYNSKKVVRGFTGAFRSAPSKLDLNMKLANKKLELLAAKDANVTFISRDMLFGRETEASYEWMPNGLPYHYDRRHISIIGSNQTFQNIRNSNSFISLLKAINKSGNNSVKSEPNCMIRKCSK